MLGPSGSGKTTLLRAILGLEPLSEGSVARARRRGATGGATGASATSRSSVRCRPRLRCAVATWSPWAWTGIGSACRSRGAASAQRVDRLIEAVGARDFADQPGRLLSGGEQQRLRVGQALADDPRLLLCDEPLTSLDLANQQAVVGLIDRHRRDTGAAVLLVTHDINPVLGKVDRILYLANGRFMLGRPDEVLDSRVLTDLYGVPVFVLRAGNRLVVVGAPDAEESHHHHEHDEDARMNWADIWDAMFGGLPVYGEILGLVWNAVVAGAVLGLVGGLVGVFVMQRDMAFAVHGIASCRSRAPRQHC